MTIKKSTLLTFCFMLLVTLCSAQKNVAKFFPAAAVPSGGSANLHNLLKGYLTPIAEDFGTLGNNGWYTTAGTHKQWGFDINVTVNNININSAAKTFAPPVLSGIDYYSETPLQTAYGEEGVFPEFYIYDGENYGISFRGADGADPGKELPIGSLAVPTLQLGLGVFKNTDLYVRFTPAFEINDVEIGNWGVGVKHDIKQHFAGIADLPFALSVFAGYTSLKATTDLSGFYDGNGQEGVAQSNSYTFQVLVGKEMKVLSLYAGVGYNASKTTYEINGTYNVDETSDGESLFEPVQLNNPFSDTYKKSGIRATAGLRLKFGPVILNGDYTMLSKRSILTAGFGFTFDKPE